jgi:flagellar L-ring protein precursor FlgH
MKLKLIAFSSLFLSGLATAQVDIKLNDGSLYGTRSGSLIASRTAFSKGDIITILISEQSASQFVANTTTSKKDTNTVSPVTAGVLSWLKVPVVSALLGGASTGANSTVAGQGTTLGSSNFVARVSAIVRDVMPNGNLVVEGTRDIRVNKETQTLVISGVIRRDDILPDNTIPSEKLALAEIRSDSKGQIGDRQRRGFLTRILDWLF